MTNKRIKEIALFLGAAVLLLGSILYFASAGTARMVANAIDQGVDRLVESNDGDGSGVALFLSTLGVGASVAVVMIYRIAGVFHIIGSLITGIQAVVVKLADDKNKKGLAIGFTIWALIRHFVYIVIHGIVFVIAGLNFRSALIGVGLFISFVMTIVFMALESKKKKAPKSNLQDPVIHM